MIPFQSSEHFDNLRVTELHQTDMILEACAIITRGGVIVMQQHRNSCSASIAFSNPCKNSFNSFAISTHIVGKVVILQGKMYKAVTVRMINKIHPKKLGLNDYLAHCNGDDNCDSVTCMLTCKL